jgi:transcriptional regulator with XRE-family HTH domain
MKEDIKDRVSKRLRELRLKRGYTQEELSELAEIEYKHIQRIESKRPCDIKISTLDKLARALKTTPSKLLGS